MMNKKAQAYETLKRQIISIELAPGTPINEADLALRLGVSKTPLREALTQLDRDGFVDNVPARGSSISHISAREVDDVLRIREIIEVGVAKRVAAVGGTPELLRERDATAQLLKSGNTPSEYVYEWGTFEDMHRTLVESLGNQLLISVYSGLMDRIARIRNFYGDRFTRRRLEDIVAEHTAILDAVVCGDTVNAELAMTRHLQNARAFLGGLTRQENGVESWSMS
jgi:DNA-binding GntR family transcriptional regulator